MSSSFLVPESPDRDYLLSLHRLLSLRIDQLREINLGNPSLQGRLRQFEALTAETIQLVEEVAVRLATKDV
jgi:hypothetical protein